MTSSSAPLRPISIHSPPPPYLLVTGRADNLPGKEHALAQASRFQRPIQARPPPLLISAIIARIYVIVLDVVAGPLDLHGPQPLHRSQYRQLHLLRKRPRQAVGVNQLRVEPLRLQERVVAVALPEPLHLLGERGAVPRADPPLDVVVRQQVRVLDHERVRLGIRSS